MKKLSVLLALTCASLFFVSCQTVPYQGKAREVKRKPMEGGIIALQNDPRPEDRMKADEKMKSNCGDSTVKVLEEGEVAVGQTTSTDGSTDHRQGNQHKVGTLFGMPLVSGQPSGTDSHSSSTTTEIKEWQISYECVTEKKKVTR
jgi:hypothetical protein